MKDFVMENQFRTTMVCVDNYERESLSGRLYNPYMETEIHFHSTMDFIKHMNKLLETMNFPQSFVTNRVFRPIPEASIVKPPMDTMKKGEIATFALKVLFRQNASWQGTIMWLEEKQEETFRSTMELLFLMDSALSLPKK